MGFADGVSNKLSTSSRQRLRNVSGSTNGGAHKPNAYDFGGGRVVALEYY